MQANSKTHVESTRKARRNLWLRCLRFLYMEKHRNQAPLIQNNNMLSFYQ